MVKSDPELQWVFTSAKHNSAFRGLAGQLYVEGDVLSQF